MATAHTTTPQAVTPGSIGEQGIASSPPQRPLTRAQFFDDPASYRAGVCEAYEWMACHGDTGGDRTLSSSAERGWSA